VCAHLHSTTTSCKQCRQDTSSAATCAGSLQESCMCAQHSSEIPVSGHCDAPRRRRHHTQARAQHTSAAAEHCQVPALQQSSQSQQSTASGCSPPPAPDEVDGVRHSQLVASTPPLCRLLQLLLLAVRPQRTLRHTTHLQQAHTNKRDDTARGSCPLDRLSLESCLQSAHKRFGRKHSHPAVCAAVRTPGAVASPGFNKNTPAAHVPGWRLACCPLATAPV
jgi:hypothetical protein